MEVGDTRGCDEVTMQVIHLRCPCTLALFTTLASSAARKRCDRGIK